jgi:hypothetical protein
MTRSLPSSSTSPSPARALPAWLLPALVLLAGGAGLAPVGVLAQEKMPPKITYEEHVKPVLRQKCFSCHNPDKKSSDLDLTNYTNLMQGGASGAVIEVGDSSGSYLYKLVAHDEEPYMPPESPKLPDEMLEVIRKWIDGGALENAGSTAPVIKKKKFDLALQDAPTARPEVAPVPARLSLEPIVHTGTTTTVTAMATNPWSAVAAIAGQKQVLLYNTQTLEFLGALPFPEGNPYVLKFSRNGSLLLVGGGRGGASGKVVVWNIKTGERVIEVGDELDAVLAADISSDHRLVALGGPQRVVRIYSTESGQLLHELRKHTDWVCSVEFSPDGVLLASGDRNGGLYVWEGWTGREYLELKAHTACVTGISWRADSNVVASCSEDGSVRLWEMENGGQVKNWGAHGGGAQSIEFVRDGRLLTCGRDRVAKLWQQDGSQIRAFDAFADLAVSVTYCDETNRAIAADWTGAIRVWDANEGKLLGELTSNPPTLESRLATAEKAVADQTAAQQPLLVAYQQTEAATNKLKADLAAAQQAATDSLKRMEAAIAKTAAAKEALSKATAAYDVATKAVGVLEPVVPLLQESLAKAQAAAAKAPEDKEVAALVAGLSELTTKRAGELATGKKTQAEQAALVETGKVAVATAEKEVTDATAALEAAKKMVETLTPQVKPAEEMQAAAKQAADAATQALAAAQQQVAHWKGEIAFNAQLQQLVAQREAARNQLAAEQAAQAQLAAAAQQAAQAAAKTTADLAAAQTAAAEAQKQVEAGTANLANAKKVEAETVAAHAAVSKTVTTLTEALVPLQQAVTTANEVAVKLSNDKELTEVATRLKAVLDGKTAELEAGKKTLAEKVQQIATYQAQVAEAEKQLVALNTGLAAVRKQVTDMTAAAKTAEEQAAAAKQVAEAKMKAVEVAQQQLDAVQSQIAVARGIEQPSAS